MPGILYFLLICFGALLMVSIFHFTIYLQQHDKAFLYYATYLLTMCLFTAVRILDARITQFLPLSAYTLETWDPILSNLAFLMYVNFLGFVLKISTAEKFYYRSWRFLQWFIITALAVYGTMRIIGVLPVTSGLLISIVSFSVIGFGIVLAVRLLRFRNEPFFRLIIGGTLVAVIGVFSGLIVNAVVYGDKLAFGGLYFLEAGMLIETIFLSAALGYRLKHAYIEKGLVQQRLLEETQRNETLAVQTAHLLRKELDVQTMQSRICQDLHDDVGASLSSIGIYSAVAQKLMDQQPQKAKQVLEQISENARIVIDNMSDIVWAMKTTEAAKASLSDRIINFGSELFSAANINCQYQIEEGVNRDVVDVEMRRNLYLIVKEALNNIAKYSEATQVIVQLHIEQGVLKLHISDNGVGFDCLAKGNGNGVGNMVDRLRNMGGNGSIKSVHGEGTLIVGRVPLTTSREKEYEPIT